MRRTLASLVALALLEGCVIYDMEHEEECWDEDAPCEPGDRDPWEGPGVDDDTGEPGTTDPIPEVDLYLSVASAAPGDTLLVWLESDDDFDFGSIGQVTFLGEVEVVDTVVRTDEAFLVIEVAPDAPLGTIQVLVEFLDGSAALIPGGFTIVEGSGGGGTDGGSSTGGSTTGGTDTGGTDTGSGGTDTGSGGTDTCDCTC